MSHPSQRWIIHVDYDAFFASVEELLNPDLRGKPVLVGGSPEGRGVVASCSYPARVFGVRSAMPMARALRLCPQAIVVCGHYRVYGQYSRKIMSMFDEITPLVEQVSIDEAFLDVTGCERLWGSADRIAGMIQRRVQDELGLSVSLGVATAKIVAKMACESGKPHGLVVVPSGHEAAFLAPLAIEKLWGVGQVTSRYLRSLGINTIGDLAEYPAAALERTLGRHAHGMQQAARGIDERQVNPGRERRSVSKESTYMEDVRERSTLTRTLLQMSEQMAAILRAQHLVGKTVRLKLRYHDFTTITRQVALETPTDQDQVIYEQVVALLDQAWPVGAAVRLIGVGVSNLIEEGGYQLSLWDHTDQRRSRLNVVMDEIRERFGDDAILRASLLERPRDR